MMPLSRRRIAQLTHPDPKRRALAMLEVAPVEWEALAELLDKSGLSLYGAGVTLQNIAVNVLRAGCTWRSDPGPTMRAPSRPRTATPAGSARRWATRSRRTSTSRQGGEGKGRGPVANHVLARTVGVIASRPYPLPGLMLEHPAPLDSPLPLAPLSRPC